MLIGCSTTPEDQYADQIEPVLRTKDDLFKRNEEFRREGANKDRIVYVQDSVQFYSNLSKEWIALGDEWMEISVPSELVEFHTVMLKGFVLYSRSYVNLATAFRNELATGSPDVQLSRSISDDMMQGTEMFYGAEAELKKVQDQLK